MHSPNLVDNRIPFKTHLQELMFSQLILRNVTQEVSAILLYEPWDILTDLIKWRYYYLWSTLHILFLILTTVMYARHYYCLL